MPPRRATWGLAITVSGTGAASLTAITAKSHDTRDPLAISISGTTWGVITGQAPLTDGRFQIAAQSKNQAVRLQRTLAPSG